MEVATLRPKRQSYLAQIAAHARSVKKDVRWTETCEGTLKEKVASRARLGDDDAEYKRATKRAREDLEKRAWTRPGRDQEGYWSDDAWSIELSDHSWHVVPEWFADEGKPLFGKLGHLLALAFTLTLAASAPVWLAALFLACLYGGKFKWESRHLADDGERLDCCWPITTAVCGRCRSSEANRGGAGKEYAQAFLLAGSPRGIR
jgi:hypothetical protein